MNVIAQIRSRYTQTQDPLRSERYLELAALAITLILLLLLLVSALKLAFLAEPEARPPSPDSLMVKDPATNGVVTAQMRSEIGARPLFFPSRRPLSEAPPPPVVDQSVASKSELDKLKLQGVFGAGDSAGVILLVEGKKQRLLIGESVKGWELKSVDLNEAQFSSGGKLETLVLQYSGARAAGNGGK